MRWRLATCIVLVLGAAASYCALVAQAIRDYNPGAFNE